MRRVIPCLIAGLFLLGTALPLDQLWAHQSSTHPSVPIPASTRLARTPVAEVAEADPGSSEPSQRYTLEPGRYDSFAFDAMGSGVRLKIEISASSTVDVSVMNVTQYSSCCHSANQDDSSALYHLATNGTAEEIPLRSQGECYLVVQNDLSSDQVTFGLSYSTVPVDITQLYRSAPAPTGIADYGVETDGATSTAYTVGMSGVTGTALMDSISAFDPAPPTNSSAFGAGLQLNAVLMVNTTSGSYVYWLQNILLLYTNNATASFIDNIWNWSAPEAPLDQARVSGSGSVDPTLAGLAPSNYYGDTTPFFSYSLPLGVRLPISMNYSGSTVDVDFAYGHTTGSVPLPSQTSVYDSVAISEQGVVTDAALLVDGDRLTPTGSYFDAELVFAGDCCRASTTFGSMNSTIALSYTLKTGGVMAPISLYDFGETGESASDLMVTPSADRLHGSQFLVSVGASNLTADHVRQNGTQIPLVVSYSAPGGGTPQPSPEIDYVSNGTQVIAPLSVDPTKYMADSGTAWQISEGEMGPSSTARWATDQTTDGTVSSSETIAVEYYHQYLVGLGFAILGGGTGYSPPTATFTQFGTRSPAGSNSTAWIDAGSPCSYPDLLPGSTSSERWTSDGTVVTVSGPGPILASYQNQYYITIATAPADSGSADPSSGWYDGGADLQISAAAGAGWNFEGWQGSGSGSYSGEAAIASIELGGPAVEKATFYPGLVIMASRGGSVSYSMGSSSGSVPAGMTVTLYLPIGTLYSLKESPSSFIDSFSGWSGPQPRTSSVVGTLAGPTSLSAHFTYNYLAFGGIAAALGVLLVVGSAFYLRRSAHERPV